MSNPPGGEHPLIVIAGPTCSGKSVLALETARRTGGEIVNCDSLQLYRGMDIGTAKTPLEERAGVPHHLFDVLEPWEVFSAGDYAREARKVLEAVRARSAVPVLAGGTGFYLRALLEGLAEAPPRNEALRARLLERESRRPGILHRLLKRLDPRTAASIHPNDVQKTVRALEICLSAGEPASAVFARGRQPLEGWRVLKLGLHPPRAALVERIRERTRRMFERGLLEEVRALLERGVPAGAKAFESIGYKEALACLRGELTVEEAMERTETATRQYAKRQMTWFRREAGMVWLNGFGDEPAVAAAALELVREFLGEIYNGGQNRGRE
ncbi:MAG: tRNA (adenosine(37)-N6)-dimethylallyltransferase MiaA [Bryobacteraceae bacterium]|jgi:tRNA dimethylallyltransferase